MKLFLGFLGPTLLLCQCSLYLPGRADGIDPNPFYVLDGQATAENRDPSRLSVPLLHSPTLEKRWGKPQLLVGSKGGYALRYQDPVNQKRHLTIFGSPQRFGTAGPIPPPYTKVGHDQKSNTFSVAEVSQTWSKTTVAGKEVRFCIGEANFADPAVQFSTETFRLTAPDGRTASYRIRSASASTKTGESAEELIASASF